MPVFHPLVCLIGFIAYTLICCTVAFSLWFVIASTTLSLHMMQVVSSMSRVITKAPVLPISWLSLEELPSWLQVQHWPGNIMRSIDQYRSPNRVTFILGYLALGIVIVSTIAWLINQLRG